MNYVLIGPQGIGKTRYAGRIADALGASMTIDCGGDWPDDRELAAIDNTLFVSNSAIPSSTFAATVFRVNDEQDLRLLCLDLTLNRFDPQTDPDLFPDAKIGDIGIVYFYGRHKSYVGRVTGIYPGSLRVSIEREAGVFIDYSFLRATGMTRRARIRFDLFN